MWPLPCTISTLIHSCYSHPVSMPSIPKYEGASARSKNACAELASVNAENAFNAVYEGRKSLLALDLVLQGHWELH